MKLSNWDYVRRGSIPSEICLTVQKHDFAIIDKQKKENHLFEQISPCEENIKYWQKYRKKLKKKICTLHY